MERHNINQMALPSAGHESYISVLCSIFPDIKEYESSGDEENCILQTRKTFEAAVEKYKAPLRVPTIFRNHKERGSWLESEHRRQKVDAKSPPEEPNVTYTFAEDIFANIIIKFSKDYPQGKQKPYLLVDKPTKFVCLRKNFCAEDAFEEAFARNPLYYNDDIKEMKKSRYVEYDEKKWTLQDGCTAKYSRVDDNENQFLVDVSVIYPENIWSTALVICCDCGKFAEITLCNAVKEAARKEIWQNIAQCHIKRKVSERERCVIRLPMVNSLHPMCSFREGLMGFTPLTQNGSEKPRLYVRTRLTYFTNETSRIGHVIHRQR